MNKTINTPSSLTNTAIDIKFKLSALWLVLMMLYIYTDFYTLLVPGTMEEILSGYKDGMIVTQVFLLVSAVVTIIPAFMIFLSLILKTKTNRWLNMILGILHIAIGAVNLVGATWGYYIFYGVSLTITAFLIVVFAWKWPKNEKVDD